MTEAALGTPLAALLPGCGRPGRRGRGAGRAGRRLPRRLAGAGPGGRAGAEPGVAAAGRRLRRARACWPRCRPAAAGWPRRPGWPATWRWSRPGSAARASTACRASPRPWPTLARPRPAPGSWADLQRWAGLVAGRGACHHPDGFVRFVASALRVFARRDRAARAAAGARPPTPAPFLPVPAAAADRSRLELMHGRRPAPAAGQPDRVQRARRVRRAAARADHPG